MATFNYSCYTKIVTKSFENQLNANQFGNWISVTVTDNCSMKCNVNIT